MKIFNNNNNNEKGFFMKHLREKILLQAKKYFAKYDMACSFDFKFTNYNDNSLNIELVYGSELHDWIRSREEYDTEKVMDIFGFKNDENYSWEWVDTNNITLYKESA